MAFTAQDVKKLREMTNVGMMDCKKALQLPMAIWTRLLTGCAEKGLAKAAKKADRVAAEALLTPLWSMVWALQSKSTPRPTSLPRPMHLWIW